MRKRNYHYVHMCHWCRIPYQSSKCERDARFCSPRCKQAHHRAYKNYVTAAAKLQTESQVRSVTPSKAKKKGTHAKKKSQKKKS